MTRRSSPSFAIGGVEPRFACIICGDETATMPILDVRAVCCTCAGEHLEFEHGYCIECGEEQEYPDCDGDVPLFGCSLHDGPIGTPASAMNGNAAARDADPAAWANWVAFCERNGMQ